MKTFVRFISLLLCVSMLFIFVSCDDDSDSGSKKTVTCEFCDKKNDKDANFCSECGKELSTKVACPECGTKNTKGAKFCADCGALLSSADNNSSGSNSNSGSSSNSNSSSASKTVWLLLESKIEATGVTIKHFYDENGYLVGKESWNTGGDMISQTAYTNDSHGNCTEMYLALYDKLGLDPTLTITNKYDTKGRITEAHNEDWNTYERYYYEGDELVKVVHVDEEGNEYYDQYDNGRLIRAYRSDSSTAYTPVTIEFYYDSNGKCTGTSYGKYEVDENGNILSDNQGTHEYITLDNYIAQNRHDNDYAEGKIGSSSSGNSSSGNSSSSGSSTQTICSACNGTGQGNECIGCDGTGQAFSYYDINDNPVYRTCVGCRGKGYIICAYCGGDGYR